ncbi:MAG TPA: radical SAM protein [Chloroflexi bacterium]|nr:radical SAM protein [Chloroflexota bacterium]
MDALEKLRLHAQEADLDRDAGNTACPLRTDHLPVYWAAAGGRRVPILKTLLTSACERNCAYCPFRAGRDARRQTFRPAALASLIEQLTHRGMVEGVLLSSGIAGGSVATQDRLLETAAILRRRGYTGYLHLKLMPGAEQAQILEALRLADRVSVNLETSGARFLRRLAPQKRFWGELLQTLQRAVNLRQAPPQAYGRARWPSLVTQFVVGAAGESDRDLLTWTARLLQEFGLQRVYFSPFRPIAQTPLENLPAEHPDRVRRLYRASFLLRDYGFSAEELFPPGAHALPHDDPKAWWAWHHLREQPVEINTAPREQLLRVPGIGPKRAEALLRARRQATLRSLSQLQALGIPPERAAPFILLDGRRPPRQARLWA